MRAAAFDPLELGADASLNSVIIGDVGCPDVTGVLAEDACSRDAFCALAAACGVPQVRPERLLDDLGSAAASRDQRVAGVAVDAMVMFGRRLGALIATLRDPATAAEQADSPGRRSFLLSWLTVDSVWVAGGLLAGRCGRMIMRGVISGASAATCPRPVRLAPRPEAAALLGAARQTSPWPGDVIAVADLGHSSIKTGVVEHEAGVLSRLMVLEPAPAPSPGAPPERVEEAVADALLRVVRTSAIHGGRARVVVSVASYVSGGVPVDHGLGIYGCLGARIGALRRRVATGSGVDVALEFIHDGTAAAMAAGSTNSATITVGTWLGCGFRPADAPPLVDVAPDFSITRR